MNAHADIFPQVPAIVKTLPDPIDQMKLFELIQIIPAPTRSALRSGNLSSYRISDPTIMGYLRNNSMFAFGQADRARTSATFREILDAMWLFNRQIRTGACQIQRDQGAAKELNIVGSMDQDRSSLCCHEARTEITPGEAGIAVVREKIRRSGLGVRRRRCTIIAAMAALVLLPIEASHAGWLSDMFKGPSKPAKSPKHVASPKRSGKHAGRRSPPRRQNRHAAKLAALGPAGLRPSA